MPDRHQSFQPKPIFNLFFHPIPRRALFFVVSALSYFLGGFISGGFFSPRLCSIPTPSGLSLLRRSGLVMSAVHFCINFSFINLFSDVPHFWQVFSPAAPSHMCVNGERLLQQHFVLLLLAGCLSGGVFFLFFTKFFIPQIRFQEICFCGNRNIGYYIARSENAFLGQSSILPIFCFSLLVAGGQGATGWGKPGGPAWIQAKWGGFFRGGVNRGIKWVT